MHQGHEPNSVADMRSAPVSREIRDVIEQLVERDLTWINIKNMIRLDKEKLGAILSGDHTNVPHSLRISYQVVYYAMTKVLNRRACLSREFDESLRLWGAKIAQSNGHWTSKNLSTYQEGMFLFAFMSDWQLTVFDSKCDKI